MPVKTTVAACAIAAFVLTWADRAHAAAAEETLSAARELYASAEYDRALTMLNGLLGADTTREERRAIELYRTLCLVAIGKTTEADRAIEAMIIQDPLYRPAADDIPPRLRSAMSDARKRILPAMIQQKYSEAKAAYDRQDYPNAVSLFKQMLDGLDDPDIATAASQSPLADLRTLAVGFHALSTKALAPPPVPTPVVAAAPEPPPIVVPKEPRLYSVEDRNVVPPIAIRQQIPSFPGRLAIGRSGVLEVIIDDTGKVESAMMRVPVNAQYDRMTLAAAKTWQYQPATVDGTPVKFRKTIQVTVVPNTP
jgi:TonB family protein